MEVFPMKASEKGKKNGNNEKLRDKTRDKNVKLI